MDVVPSEQTLGVRVRGIDLAQLVTDADFRSILRSLGRYGVLRFPRQTLDTDPEMMILSNVKKEGKQIGANDAGQGWHNAVGDYTADEPRYMRRVRVIGDTGLRASCGVPQIAM